ncbi:MAG: DUF1592 domain-containing protein [Chthoniobacter sp.]|nr:DUF1592 domain-containing protein [Chthoniobacter sp.]
MLPPANRRPVTLALATMLVFAGELGTGAQDASVRPEIFEKDVRPLIENYCLRCHSTAKQKGDLNLEQFASLAAVRKQPKIWQSVAEQLANKEMPPRDKPQPTSAERARLAQWVDAVLDEVALAHAGDPGPVVLRRLSNAEYTYTLRDLTGVESLDPAREFPVDGAAGEGFTNTGSALVMSPSLLVKYLDAAKEVASHAVLLPDGIRFSPETTRRDWTEEILAQIRAFYREFTDAGGGEKVKVTGTGMVNSDGGRIALEKYFAATLAERDALRGGSKTAQIVGRERGLNAKYLAALFAMLEAKEPSLLLDGIRERWRGAKPGEAAALAAEVARWQKALWKFGSVGHIGKVGGPRAWMEAVNPFATKQELRLKLPPSPDGQDVTIYLVASDAGDGNENDFVVWQQPRLVAKGRPDLLLRDVPAVSNELAGRFGRHPNGQPLDAASLGVRAPAVLAIHLPFDVAAGCEFVTSGTLDRATGAEGSVQLQVLTTKPEGVGLQAGTVETKPGAGSWGEPTVSISSPIIAAEGSAARKRIESAFEAFRQIFPAALCYTKIVPVDEVVTLTLFHREDEHLARLMLDDTQRRRLDRLWDELRYVSQDALTLVDVFEQIWQFSTQDGPNAPNGDKRLEPMREPINARAAAFKQRLVDTQPPHLDAVLDFANRAYRRPLTDAETTELRGLYRQLRAEELPHEEAIRLTLARVLVAPAFLYRLEKAAPGSESGPVSDSELATRLSYFLWSSAPDAELRTIADAGKLHEPDVLAAQTRRMLRDPRVRRLATEFACQWIHIRDFDHLDEKSERHFPTFIALRGAMYEESLRFFTDLFQHDGAVTDILDADYTFLNEPLAKHYGIPGVTGSEWRRVDGVKKFGRGGILGHATTLAKNSGASRTSPILRGNWIAEALLGDRLPKPPKDVPRLPEEENADTLTVRQLTEKHSSDPRCSGCHVRIDPFGFALEGFDSIGRKRDKDLANRSIDVKATLINGTPLDGLDGLRTYLLTTRRREFIDQFCRKLLGYALGRSVQLSDRPLLAEMRRVLETHNHRVTAAIETVVASRPFLQICGIQSIAEN